MTTIALIMHRKIVAQRLNDIISLDQSCRVIEVSYEQAEMVLPQYGRAVVLVEAAESGLHGISYCLELCRQLQVLTPGNVMLLMVSEKQADAVQAVIHAKQTGLIHDFLFFDNPIAYVVAKLTASSCEK